MTTAYQFQAHTRRCCVSGRELHPGEKYYSALLVEAGLFVRKDYAAESWDGPPAAVIGFWCGRISRPDEVRRPPIDDDLLVECFERLADDLDPARQRFRYVIALLLMRRRRFKFEDARRADGRETLCLADTKGGARHEVADPGLSDEDLTAVQDEVFRLLGWEN